MDRWRLIVWLFGLILLTGCRSEGSQLAAFPQATATGITPTVPAPSATLAKASTRSLPTPAKSITPSPTLSAASPTVAATNTNTPVPFSFQDSIGVSIGGRELRHYRLGFGPKQLVLIGALHGGHECNTRDVLETFHQRLLARPELIPAAITLHILPEINIDGCLLDTRENARVVDLNRNWDTPDWQEDASGPYGFVPGSGGDVPFSEPETYYLRNWLWQLRDSGGELAPWIVTYHSAVPPTGLVLPAYRLDGQIPADALTLARLYAEYSGYDYSEGWIGGYNITGEFVFWLGLNGFTAIDVELPDRQAAEAIPAGWTSSHIDTNWGALLAIFELMAAG